MSHEPLGSPHFDVVVVGARCAGSSTARLLAQRGLRVLVVDRASFPSDTVSTHSITSHGVALLDHWGLLAGLRDLGTPSHRVLGVKIGPVDLGAVPIPDASKGTLCPRRTVLDAYLLDAARREGATVWEQTPVDSLLIDDGRVRGVIVRRDGERVEVRADLVIGADGMRSKVAKSVGALEYNVRPSQLSGVYAYYAGTEAEFSGLAVGGGWLAFAFMTNDDLTCLAIGAHTREEPSIIGADDAGFAAHLDKASPAFGEMARRGARRSRYVVYRGQPGVWRTPWGPGWALVGDAGYYKDPFTGQGIADAFLSAHLLARATCDGLGGGSPMADAMDEYHRTRDELHTEMYEVTHEMAAMTWDDDELMQLFLRYRAIGERTLLETNAMLAPVAANA